MNGTCPKREHGIDRGHCLWHPVLLVAKHHGNAEGRLVCTYFQICSSTVSATLSPLVCKGLVVSVPPIGSVRAVITKDHRK